MPSKVVRIVNLPKNVTADSLELFIKVRIVLTGQIEKIFVRESNLLNLVFAYVVFEVITDAQRTVYALNGIFHENKKLNAELIGPHERYTKFNTEVQPHSWSRAEDARGFLRARNQVAPVPRNVDEYF